MDQASVSLVVATVGVVGTLSAALLTQLLSLRAERLRRAAEDRSRWLADRLRISSQFLAKSLSLERDLWSAAAQLDRDDRAVRMPGHTTILLTPDEGLPGVLDAITREILVEEIEKAFERLDELEEVAAEIALVGSPSEVEAASELHESLWSVVGLLEAYAPFDEAADAVEACRSARDRFLQAARTGLRAEGQVPAIDNRPRLEDDPNIQR